MRRNRRDPFNPFAPGASNKSQKKVIKQQPIVNKNVITNLSRKEQLEAMKRKVASEQKRKETLIIEEPQVEEPKVEEPKVEEPKIEEPKVEEPKVEEPKIEEPKIEEPKVEEPKVEEPKVEEPNIEKPKVEITENNETKLDELKRRSDELAAKTGISLPKENYSGTLFSKPSVSVPKEPKKPVVKVVQKHYRKTKSGGGRQPKQKKLSRRKQLEFRFDARAILDNSDVDEEHRSNIFGQIWAKGERIGIDSAIEYIVQKEQEGILSSDVSGKLEALIKSYSTKR